VSGTTTTSGGAVKIIGGGRGIGGGMGGTGNLAIAETGAKTTNVKINILKNNFFIGLPPYILMKQFIKNNKCSSHIRHH
jgi:hypothetical protein